MNPTDPGALPAGALPKPWHKPQPGDDGNNSTAADAGNALGGLAEGAADVAGGALEATGSVADAAGGVLEGAGGCLDGCSGCSLAILVTLFAAAGTATALFR